jgi:hypothetical protein
VPPGCPGVGSQAADPKTFLSYFKKIWLRVMPNLFEGNALKQRVLHNGILKGLRPLSGGAGSPKDLSFAAAEK